MSELQQNLRSIVRGTYDLQQLRIQMGNRVVGNFKIKLGQQPSALEATLPPDSLKLLQEIRALNKKLTDGVIKLVKEPEEVDPLDIESDDIEETDDIEEQDELVVEDGKPKKEKKPTQKLLIKKIDALLKLEHGKATDKKKRFPKPDFIGNAVISDYTELCLVDEYIEIHKNEEKHFARLENVLQGFPVYTQFLAGVKGCGPAMSGVIVSEFDITKAEYPSSFWMYCGLDVAQDGKGRSRREEHLVMKKITNKAGDEVDKLGITFNPFLKTKLVGVLGSCFLRSKSPYKTIYDNYRNRLENHPVYGIANEAAHKAEMLLVNPGRKYAPKLHRHNMAVRYMIKQFLVDLHMAWRKAEGLPVSVSYSEAKLKPHRKAA